MINYVELSKPYTTNKELCKIVGYSSLELFIETLKELGEIKNIDKIEELIKKEKFNFEETTILAAAALKIVYLPESLAFSFMKFDSFGSLDSILNYSFNRPNNDEKQEYNIYNIIDPRDILCIIKYDEAADPNSIKVSIVQYTNTDNNVDWNIDNCIWWYQQDNVIYARDTNGKDHKITLPSNDSCAMKLELPREIEGQKIIIHNRAFETYEVYVHLYKEYQDMIRSKMQNRSKL